jgi:pimeloyl-ACP methyl ester carboxylesterase
MQAVRNLSEGQRMPTVDLLQGPVHYRESGTGEPVVFLHGYLMDSRLWEPVTERLPDLRCVALDLPLGAHPVALHDDADLSIAGVARLVADFLEALELEDVTLVGNDSGGAIAQVVAADHPERLGRLVLATCDAFDNFPPKIFRPLIAAAKVPGGLNPLFAALKARPARKLPNAYGALTHGDLPHDLIDAWLDAYFADEGVRRDVRKVTVGLGDDGLMLDVAARLTAFHKPALLAWATDDAFFPMEHAERLAAILPDSRLEPIEHSRTWVMRDQPERLAQLIREFVSSSGATAASASASTASGS